MARNIELKAHDPDPARSLEIALALGATDEGWLQQLDTYFKVGCGRLKLREQDGAAELIQYERADEAIERTSNYRLVPIKDLDVLKEALARALGILVVVEKSRRLLLWRNVRIHLDEVPGLGSFIELEAVADLDSDLSGEYQNVAELRRALGITDERILAVGYSDQLLAIDAGRAQQRV
jgi:adenylate cyclase, class 2